MGQDPITGGQNLIYSVIKESTRDYNYTPTNPLGAGATGSLYLPRHSPQYTMVLPEPGLPHLYSSGPSIVLRPFAASRGTPRVGTPLVRGPGRGPSKPPRSMMQYPLTWHLRQPPRPSPCARVPAVPLVRVTVHPGLSPSVSLAHTRAVRGVRWWPLFRPRRTPDLVPSVTFGDLLGSSPCYWGWWTILRQLCTLQDSAMMLSFHCQLD